MQRLALLTLLLLQSSLYAQKTIFWEVKDPLGNHTSYLLGTYHQLGNSFVDSIPLIKEKLLSSEVAIFESVDAPKVRSYILERPDDYLYRKVLPKGQIKWLESHAEETRLPLPKLTATELYFVLFQRYYQNFCGNVQPEDEWKHFDTYLMYVALENKIPCLGLESDSLQLNSIQESYGVNDWKNMKKKLSYWINAHKGKVKEDKLCKFAYKYRSFNLDYKLDEPCVDEVMGKNRNDKWMKNLPMALKRESCFVAVGLAHLMYECGLISQLRDRGFTVEPISLMPSS
ncbi:MAG: TraB/GumN family protein [Bacteroidota bacterium]